MISTKDPEYLDDFLDDFPKLKDNIEVYNAKTRQELLNLIAISDIGLLFFQILLLFNSSTP